MKLKNIFISLLAATALVACSDDESWNSGAATVEMGQPTVSVRENAGLFNVPITVTGEQNDYIRVTVEVAETGSTPAMEDVHYYVTSKSIVIPADATSGNIEISAVNDNDINDTRTFTVTIVSAEGATIGSQSSTTVELRDEDSDFYERLKGNWTMSMDMGGGQMQTFSVTVSGPAEGEDGYGEVLYATGIMGYDFLSLTLGYEFDVATQTGSVSILLGELMGSNITGLLDVPCDIYVGSADESGNPLLTGSITGTWNEDVTTVTFDPEAMLVGWVTEYQASQVVAYFFAASGVSMTK